MGGSRAAPAQDRVTETLAGASEVPGEPLFLRRPWVFGRFWTARALSNLGDGAALVALVLYVQQVQGTGAAVSALLLAGTLPTLLGPISGALADRLDQRRLMLGADLGEAGIYAVIAAFLPRPPILFLLVAAAAVLHTLFAPAGRSAVPVLAGSHDVRRANAWMAMAANLRGTLGVAIGGALAASAGFRAVLAINSVTFAISAILIRGLPPLLPEAKRQVGELLRDTAAGMSYSLRHPVARALIVGLGFGVMFAAVDDVALVFLARDDLGAGALGYGVLAAAYGIGMLAAALLMMRSRATATTVFLLGWLVTGLGGVATALAPSFAVALIAQATAGSGNGLDNVATDTLVHTTVPRAHMGRVFGVVTTAALVGGAIARGLGGVLLDLTSPRTTFMIGGIGVLATTAMVGAMLSYQGVRNGAVDEA